MKDVLGNLTCMGTIFGARLFIESNDPELLKYAKAELEKKLKRPSWKELIEAGKFPTFI